MARNGGPHPGQFLDYLMSRRGNELPPIPGACVITHSRRLLELAAGELSHTMVDIGSRMPMGLHFLEAASGMRLAMIAAHPGAPMAAVVVEELVALGVERFLCVGGAGHPTNGTTPTLAIGDIVLATRALVYEGTSGHYDPASAVAHPDAEELRRLRGALTRGGHEFVEGAVATTDAIYRETPQFVRSIVDLGAVAVDMELSAAFTVGRFRSKRVAGLLWISDIVGAAAGWSVGFDDERIDRLEEGLLPVIMDWAGER